VLTSSFATFVYAVLIDMEGVEEVRVPGLLARGGRGPRPGRHGRVQVEGGLLGRGHSQFAVVLELGAQQRVVPQVHAWTLLAIWFKGNDADFIKKRISRLRVALVKT